jgi:parallel beta-helix repeat protein
VKSFSTPRWSNRQLRGVAPSKIFTFVVNRFFRLAVVSFATVLLAVGAFNVAPAGAAPSTTYVATTGTNGAGCGTSFHPCQTITYALGITANGGSVNVAPGTYHEQVVISHPVSIVGSGSSTVIEPATLPVSDVDSDSTTTQLAVVDVTPGTKSVSLSNLSVNGVAASPSFTDCATDFVGVYYHDATGSLSNVSVTNIELPTSLFGCQDGLGVYVTTDVGSTTASNVSFSNVSVTNYDKNGITCDDLGTVCSITNSTVTGIGATPLIAQNGIQGWGASLTLSGDTVRGNSYTSPNYTGPGTYYTEGTGVLIINAGTLSVTSNNITGNDDNLYAVEAGTAWGTPPDVPKPGAWNISSNNVNNAVNNTGTAPGSVTVPFGLGIGDGIDIDSTAANVTVSGNTASNDPEFGVALYGASGVTASYNNTTSDGDGFYVGGPGSVGATSSKDTFNYNTAESNKQDGFFVDTASSADTFTGNVALYNGKVDVVDASTGKGTAKTANTWTATTCSKSTPSGLCGAYAGYSPYASFSGFYGSPYYYGGYGFYEPSFFPGYW